MGNGCGGWMKMGSRMLAYNVCVPRGRTPAPDAPSRVHRGVRRSVAAGVYAVLVAYSP